jgi:hypothetical protein
MSPVQYHDGDVWGLLRALQHLHGDRHYRHLHAHVHPSVSSRAAMHAKRHQRDMYVPMNMEI